MSKENIYKKLKEYEMYNWAIKFISVGNVTYVLGSNSRVNNVLLCKIVN